MTTDVRLRDAGPFGGHRATYCGRDDNGDGGGNDNDGGDDNGGGGIRSAVAVIEGSRPVAPRARSISRRRAAGRSGGRHAHRAVSRATPTPSARRPYVGAAVAAAAATTLP